MLVLMFPDTETNTCDSIKEEICEQDNAVSASHKQASARAKIRETPGTSAARVHRYYNHCSTLNMTQIQRLSDLVSLCFLV